MMPCPTCSGRQGLTRIRSRAVLAGERHYRCLDCQALWRCSDRSPDALTRLGSVIETHGEIVVPALPPKPPGRLVGWERGRSPDEIERALQLETVPEAEQGKRVDLSTSAHDAPKLLDPATAKRLRAITRAPDAVKDAGHG